MADVDSGLIRPFLGALQACTSVLLTLLYGLISRQAGLLSDTSINQMSGLCVKVFLPALIMVKLGSELSLDIATHYIPIFGTRDVNPALQLLKNHLPLIRHENLVWALLYILISIGIGYLFTRCLRLPVWVTPALAFNNTSSLPLLLLQTLHATGSLKLIRMPGQSESDCLNRAQSYLLICAVVSNTMSYALGPRMLRPSRTIKRKASVESRNGQANGSMTSGNFPSVHFELFEPIVMTVNCQQAQPQNQFLDCNTITEQDDNDNQREDQINEQTSLLPKPLQRARHTISSKTHHFYSVIIPQPLRRRIKIFDSAALDAAVLCAATGIFLGLVPTLHRAFFSPFEQGGIFNAWLISSIEHLGSMFTTLQMYLVGCKLGVSFQRMKRFASSSSSSFSSSSSAPQQGQDEETNNEHVEHHTRHSREESPDGKVPIRAILVVYAVRLILWPMFVILIHHKKKRGNKEK